MKRYWTIIKQFFLLIITCIFSMGLFLTSYRYDNKYVLSSPQPIGGILFFNPSEAPITHLINGWQFYGDKLLSPDDFKGTSILPDGYVSIGQYTGMEAGLSGASPHGSATYRLLLSLPDTPASYTLELPEIYSAYRLYINDKLAAFSGVPEKENYQAEIRSGSITFEASGNTILLLAISDWSYLYSGLVYPPAFGKSDRVNALLDQKFAWGIAVAVLAFLLGIFQTALAFILKSRRTFYTSLICTAFAVSVSSPAFHRLFTTGITPFYNVELFCRYAVYGAAVLLVNHLYGGAAKVRIAVSSAAIIFPIAAFAVSLAAPGLSYQGMLLFSSASDLYKWLCAIWILVIAFMSGLKMQVHKNTLVLLAGSSVFASSLAADRLFPSFEPIRFCWFSETAGLIFVLLISFLMFRDSFRLYRDRILLAQEKEKLEEQIRLQKKHYTELVVQMETIRTMRHDIRHHFTQLALLLKESKFEEAANYLIRVNHDVLNTTPLSFCDNYIVDVLLRYYYAQAASIDANVSFCAELQDSAGISDEELTVILGNVLENAMEASLRLPASQRFLSLHITKRSNNLFVESSNAFNGDLKTEGKNYLSAKEKGRRGLGLSSIRTIADKYNGEIWIDTVRESTGYVFTIHILLLTNDT